MKKLAALKEPQIVALSAAFVAFFVTATVPGVLNDGDTLWHIAAGRLMLEQHAVLNADPFSYTFFGQPWHTHEWLAEVVMALAYLAGGWRSELLLFAATAALIAGMLAWHLSRWLRGFALIATAALAMWCMAASLLARPHLFAILLLEIWTAQTVIAAERGTRPSFWLLPLMTIWANVHASFILALPLTAALGCESGLRHGQFGEAARQWGQFLLLAALASLATPHGFDTLLFPFKVLAMPNLELIREWRPADLHGVPPMLVAMGTALLVCLWRGVRMSPVRAMVILGIAYMALLHGRYQIVLATVGPLLLAEPLAVCLGAVPLPHRAASKRPVALLFAAMFLAIAGLRTAVPVRPVDGMWAPAGALAHVPASVTRGRVLNDYGFGGYLIFHHIKPFIDGRTDLYGSVFLADYERAVSGDDAFLRATLTRFDITWTILRTGDPVVSAMDRQKGWHRLWSDSSATVHVRDNGF